MFAGSQRLLHQSKAPLRWCAERDRINLPTFGAANLVEPPGDRGIGFRLELFERQKLHFAHVFVHAHALCQRGIDIHRFLGDTAALVFALDVVERAHVVQPIG